MLKTPVVLIIFNRPDLTKKVFHTIRQAAPEKLFIIADGARFIEEEETCQQTRHIIEQVDWNCEVHKNYSDINLGCRERVSTGLTWVFQQVEEAIILEDDCLPHSSFFDYCETLIDYYRDDERIMVISGNNHQDGQKRTSYSYYFSKYNHCWGWATWRRAWNYWEFNPQKWIEFRDTGLMKFVCDNSDEVSYWTTIFNNLFIENRPNSWAYAWTFACWSQGGLSILPEVNLVSNIGFGPNATHTQNNKSQLSCLPRYDIRKIKHSPFVVRCQKADQYTFDHLFGGLERKYSKTLAGKFTNLFRKIKNRIIR